MLSLYIFTEFLFLVLIIINKLSVGDIFLISIFKFVPILLNILFSFIKKVDEKLRFALLVTAIADFIFLFIDNCTLGISFFVLVQIIYYLYLSKSKNKVILFLSLINIMLVFLFQEKLLIIESIIYSLFILVNIFKSCKLSKTDKEIKLVKYSLILLLLCDLCIGVKYIFDLNNNLEILLNILEWLFYIPSQMVLVIYALKLNDAFLYRVLQPIFTFIFKVYYNPTIINKEYIPKDGSFVIAGNHKHALDPILVDVCTKRIVHTLAKKDLHDGKFGWFFRAIGTIPVDLYAKHNKEALNNAIDFLNNGNLINLSPEAKRNYTKEILLPFKFGAVVMAKRTNSKIIPYSITGDYKFRSKNLKIVFDKPLDISNLSVEEANELLYKKVKKLIIDNRKQCEIKHDKKSQNTMV